MVVMQNRRLLTEAHFYFNDIAIIVFEILFMILVVFRDTSDGCSSLLLICVRTVSVSPVFQLFLPLKQTRHNSMTQCFSREG